MQMIVPEDSAPRAAGDTRASQRVKATIALGYSFDLTASREEDFRRGMLLDISERGLCFRATDLFFVQRLIALFLKLSDQSSGMRILGKSVWTAPDGAGATRVGVQFIGTLPSDWRGCLTTDEDFSAPDDGQNPVAPT